MDAITPSDLQGLCAPADGPVVSIYLPTHRAGQEAQQDPIQLKNLLTEAEDELVARGVRPAEARELLAPARDLVSDDRFWTVQGDGLALIVTPSGLRYWRMPASLEPFVSVGRQAYLRPLIPLATNGGRYFVLAVSQNQVKLFRGTPREVVEIESDALPRNLVEALNYDQPEGMFELHTGQTALRNKEGAVYHGQGGAVDAYKDDILAYFRTIDRALRTLLRGERAPLLFAGVGYLLPLYRRANSYPQLFPQAISGNPERLSTEALRKAALELLEPVWRQARRRELDRIAREAGSAAASSDVAEVLAAAQDGRVDSLVVDIEAHLWGRFDPATRSLAKHPQRQAGDDDLYELAVLAALSTGARVLALPAAELPAECGELTATFRYAIANTAG